MARRKSRLEIDVQFYVSSIKPLPPPSLYEPFFDCPRSTFERTPRGLRSVKEALPMGYPDETRNRLYLATGLIDDFGRHCRKQGHNIVLNDHREFAEQLDVRDDSVPFSDDLVHHPMLQIVESQPLGRIVSKSETNVLERIAAICRYFPEARVLIPLHSKSKIEGALCQLESHFGSDVYDYETFQEGRRGEDPGVYVPRPRTTPQTKLLAPAPDPGHRAVTR